MASARGASVFVSYSRLDDEFRKRFETHMAQLHREGVRTWFDGDIAPGGELDPNIMRALKQADIFVALASPNYLASRYCFETEYGFALRKAARKKLFVVVVLLRQCQWRHTRMARYKVLPKDAKPIDQWARRGDAWENVVEGIRAVVKQFRLVALAPDPPKKPKSPAPKRTTKAKPAGVRPRRVTSGKAAAAANPTPKHGVKPVGKRTRPIKPRGS